MSTTLVWLKIVHIFGIIVWIAGLLATLSLLRAHATISDGAAREALTKVEKQVAMLMDLGATIAIICGLGYAFSSVPNEFKHGGWLHAKLGLVVLGILGLHGFARAKIKRFSKGEVKPVPNVLVPVLLVLVFLIVILAGHPTLMRG